MEHDGRCEQGERLIEDRFEHKAEAQRMNRGAAKDGSERHRSRRRVHTPQVNIAQIAKAMASAAASTGSAIQVAQAIPTVADTRFRPIIDQGCASGLAGTA